MLKRTYDDQVCSLARTLEVVGERWTLLIIRDTLTTGASRFDDFLERLDIARNVLTDRLRGLVEHGVLERARYQERPERFEYRLTAKGMELATPVVALMTWGDRHLAGPEGPPRVIEHPGCGGRVSARLVCEECGQMPDAVTTRQGPGARPRDSRVAGRAKRSAAAGHRSSP
jgi:DNA-binding HxlR family transcriptional regulator